MNRKSLRISIYASVAAACFVCPFIMAELARGDTSVDPLFAGEEIIEVRIEASFRTIMHERSIDEESPAILNFVDSDGSSVRLDAKIRSRGRFRRRPDIFDFTPLLLNFKKSKVKRTLFDHQDKLKLVTHCNSSSPRYEQYVFSEYLVYRILNLLTDVSFRIRLLRVTYVDTDRNDRRKSAWVFLIEHRDRLAKRIGASVVETYMVTYPDLNAS